MGQEVTIYLTSDQHFNHKNIIKYCDRPFANTDYMNTEIIRNYNNIVKDDDIVYHLGYNNDEEIQEQLNIAKNRLYLASFIFDEKIDELNLPIGTNPDTDLILSEQFPKPSDTGEDD